MSDLSRSLVDAAAEAANAVDCPHIADLDYGQSSCQTCEVRAAVGAVLETLAERYHTWAMFGADNISVLRGLAAEVKEERP